MVKTNQFIRIESYYIPLPIVLVERQIPIVTLDREHTRQFKGYVLDLVMTRTHSGGGFVNTDPDLDWDDDLDESSERGGPYFNFMILVRDWDVFCKLLSDSDQFDGDSLITGTKFGG
jgi:hypothetical protein